MSIEPPIERYTGHLGMWWSNARWILSRSTSPSTRNVYATWMRLITRTPSSLSISPRASLVSLPSFGLT